MVLDRQAYQAEGFRQLLNTKYYHEIEGPMGMETCPMINKIIKQLYNKGIISAKQCDYLWAKPPRPFYLLSKVHKPHNKWPSPTQPEGRPIVSDSGSETCNICEFINFFLQPLASTHPSYIKDTYHFLTKVQHLTIPEHALLVTGDVTALYTNMEINQSLQAVRDIFQEFPQPGRPEVEILSLLEIALRRNDFQFANKYFLQVCGTAMGKR